MNASPENTRVYPLSFTGSGGEYFRIWIVNLALTLLTFGIYSAWAKVRRKRYFNNHTLLDGHPFDYLADPKAILKGRLIAFAFFAVYALTQRAYPLVSGALLLLFFAVSPWIVVRALQFNARNTSHRGLRFNFLGRMGESYQVFLGLGIMTLVTAGLAAPYAAFRKTEFVAGNHAFGATRSSFQGQAWDFYKIYLVALLILLVPIGLAVAWLVSHFGGLPAGGVNKGKIAMAVGALLIAVYASLPILIGFMKARAARLMIAGTRFGELGLLGTHRARRLIWLYVSNLILIALTFGIFIPWAQVRTARFWVDNLSVTGPEGGLDGFAAAAGEGLSATGAEMADVFDVDLAIA